MCCPSVRPAPAAFSDMKMPNLPAVWKKIGCLLLNFILLFGLLRLIIRFAETQANPMIYYVGSTVYFLAAAALAVLYYVWNGCTLQKEMPTPDMLPADWSPEKRQAYLVKLAETRKKAQKLLYILFPLVLVTAFSYLELFIL